MSSVSMCALKINPNLGTSGHGSVIVLVAVPLLVLVLFSIAVCGFVLWLRSKRQHHQLQKHDPPMIKVPNGGDPAYGVCAAHELQCLIRHAQLILPLYYRT